MTDVFNNDATNDHGNGTPPPQNGIEDLLKNIKNEQGEQKYKSLEDALVALDHSQKYIPELKTQLTGAVQEIEKLRGDVSKFGNIEETVQRLLTQHKPPADTTPAASGLDEQAVLDLVQRSLNQTKQVEMMNANQQKVNDTLVSKFGEKAIEVLDHKAAELKTTRQALGELAKQNPDLVLALFSTPANKDPNPAVSSRTAPPPVQVQDDIRKPDKSLLAGATAKQQAAFLDEIRRSIYAKHGIDS